MTGTSLHCRAEKTEVTLRAETMILDFAGECQVEHDGDVVRLKGLRLVAELPDAGGAEDGGTVVLAQDGDASQAGPELTVPLSASVAQPGGQVHLTGRARWTVRSEHFEPVGDEVGFVLGEFPDSKVLSVRGLALRTTPAR